MIFIYKGPGVSEESYQQIKGCLEKIYGAHHRIDELTAEAVIQGDWAQDATLFVMPGGADIPYMNALNGVGNIHIRTFVKKGGHYLGICAGAYYGTSFVSFNPDGPLTVQGPRELAFFQGTAHGPSLAPYDYNSHKGARLAALRWGEEEILLYAYYDGGCHFEGRPIQFDGVTVLARYDAPHTECHHKPAIIFLPYGQGRVVLSGVHFEYMPELLSDNDDDLKNLKAQMYAHKKTLETLQRYLFNRLGI